MSKYTLLFFLALAGAFPCVYAQATHRAAASQAWVMNYVSNFVANSAAEVQAGTTVENVDGVTTYTASAGTDNEMRLVVWDSSDAALKVSNCSNAATLTGLTNGTIFVWNGAGKYINPQGTIWVTKTNFVYNGVSSRPVDGVDRFDGWFDVQGVLIQPVTSAAVTNGMTEVVQ